MSKSSDAKNQHYVSRAEQRLNAIDPKIPNRIHAFRVVDREHWSIHCLSPKIGQSIKNTPSCTDLFSFHVVSNKHRQNLESRFQTYENDIGKHSQELLDKLRAGCRGDDIKDEVQNIFANICTYTSQAPNHICLLSDRGINSYDMQTIVSEIPGYTFEFNITARGFACFTFCDPSTLVSRSGSARDGSELKARVNVVHSVNRLEALVSYNRRTVYQAAKTVFGASAAPML